MIINQRIWTKVFLTIFGALALLLQSGCSTRTAIGEPRENIEAAEEIFEIGVNAYLWRAALDTMAFMPILSADQNGGVILTDWKVNPSNVNERSKADIFIVGKELRADVLKVTVHREKLQDGNWVSIAPRSEASTQIISAIIIQARLLRRDNAPATK